MCMDVSCAVVCTWAPLARSVKGPFRVLACRLDPVQIPSFYYVLCLIRYTSLVLAQ